ncbi:GNAT family N-acetyltransferase [bacterium]|nr:GNAT family N-acetyltransferase [bacterium]
MGVEISKIVERDIESTAKVMVEAFNFVNQGWTEEDGLKNIEMILNYDYSIKATVEGKIVGFLASYIKDDHLYIDEIAVLPKHMGKGIGKELWKNALEFAREMKLDYVKLIADPKSDAYKWYSQIGFKETGWVEMSLEA